MRRHRFAEALLGSLTAPDRAAAIVGDLVEESRSRGRFWYVRHMLGTALALCFAAFRAAPVRAVAAGVLGFVLFTVFYLSLLAATGLDAFVLWFDPSRTPLAAVLAHPRPFGEIAVLVALSNLLTGAVLGRFAAIDGLRGSVPMAALLILYMFAWPGLAFYVYGMQWLWVIAGAGAAPVLYFAPLFLGDFLARRRGLAG